jgi:adenylate kinase
VLGTPIIASGDIFRAIGRDDTPLAREVRQYMQRGEYVPDELTIEVVMRRLMQPDARNGFILDGFPRTGAQAQALDKYLAEEGRRVDVALHMTAPNDVLERRLGGRMICPVCNSIYNMDTKPPKHDMVCDLDGTPLERRDDEETHTIRTRLETHVRETRPLIEYYGKHGSLVEIDGSRPMDEVESEIDKALNLRPVS